MKTITKVLIAGITAALLTACGSSSSSNTTPTAQDQAIDKISNYAQNGGAAPTLQDYLDAGVTGITNLDEVNAYVSGLAKEDVDTKEEIQTIAAKLGVSLSPVATIYVTRTANTEEADILFPEGQSIRFSAEQSTDPDGHIVSYLWTEGSIKLASISVFDIATLSVGKHTVTLTVTDNHGNNASTDIVVKVMEVVAVSAEVAQPVPQTCLEAAGYETVELSNGQVWFDRNLGAAAVGDVGALYTFDESANACPCGFTLPLPGDIWNGLWAVDESALFLTDGVYWMDRIGYAAAVFNVSSGIASGTVQYGGPISSSHSIRCIDPSTSIRPL